MGLEKPVISGVAASVGTFNGNGASTIVVPALIGKKNIAISTNNFLSSACIYSIMISADVNSIVAHGGASIAAYVNNTSQISFDSATGTITAGTGVFHSNCTYKYIAS